MARASLVFVLVDGIDRDPWDAEILLAGFHAPDLPREVAWQILTAARYHTSLGDRRFECPGFVNPAAYRRGLKWSEV